jgi:hypothetical protein
MRLRLLVGPLLWAVGLVLLGAVLGGVHLVHLRMQAERAREGGDKVESPKRAKAGVIELDREDAERYGLTEERARAVEWYEQVPVYGRVVPNPRATVEVRSPFAGTLRPAPASSWPALGKPVRSGQVLGLVEVRVGPEVRLDLENKLADARIKQRGAEEEVRLQQGRADSLQAVTAQQIISRVELDAALIQLAQAKNQLATAKAAAELWEKALGEIREGAGRKGSPWRRPLTAPADGEVTELAARPGMDVEAGGLVAQVVDFRRPLVRLDLPPGALPAGPSQRVELFPTPPAPPALRGALNQPHGARLASPVEATRVGPAPRLDVTSQFVGYWYEVGNPPGGALWRPGLQVKAYLRPPDAAPQPAVSVPAAAVLYHEGRALVYVRLTKKKYERREVRLLGREGDRWVLARRKATDPTGVVPGERIVANQAQVLLSEEFRGVADDD